MGKVIDDTNLGYLISKGKAAFWPKSQTVQIGLDDAPTENSDNIVKSGGVFDAIEDVMEAIDGSNVETVTVLPTASASTVGKIYYVGPDSDGEYARYRGIESGGSYSFLPLGSTAMDLTDYATKEELSQLEHKVTELFFDAGLPDVNLIITYSIANELTNCVSDNPATSVEMGDAYAATITPDQGYDLSTVTVLMGGLDVTEDVYDGAGGISIASVQGNVEITAVAVEHGVATITFADPIVEQIAYAQGWDDDGVFTEESLAAVTAIGAVFNGTAIETFDEFQYFTGLSAVRNELAQNAFKDCTALTSIVIPENCPIYGTAIFMGCNSLTNIVVPDGVTKITGSFFRDCTSLVTIDLGSGITSIGNLWAQNDAAVTTLICRAATPPTADWSLFTGMSNLAHIYVPAASVDAYKAAANWSSKASIIEAIPE